MLFAIDIDAPAYVNRHALSVCGKKDNITPADLLQFARMNDIRRSEQIIQQVKSALSHWVSFVQQADVPTRWQAIINEYIQNNLK